MAPITITLGNVILWTHIGVTEEERSLEQAVEATVTLTIESGADTTDDLGDTVDYAHVYALLQEEAKRERKTLEKFAGDIADLLLREERVGSVSVSLTKRVLPSAKAVIVSLTRP